MTEKFLHFIWAYRLYPATTCTTAGETLSVLDPGTANQDAGPDFSNARIKIGDTVWAGNVEIHLKSSDWYVHKHQTDKNYLNVILHVVYEDDKIVLDLNGIPLSTLVLKGDFFDSMYRKYYYYLNNKKTIPCEKDFATVQPLVVSSWLERMLAERMERKAKDLGSRLKHNRNNVSETFYQMLAGNFGFKTNQQPFTQLAMMLPMGILAKHSNSLFQIEALLFGCSGMLNRDFEDEYPNQLKQEFGFFRKKYNITTIQEHLWKFLRLRPSNFPTLRISQFAALIHKSNNLSSTILETENIKDLEDLFDLTASTYWNDHYSFDKESRKKIKTLGQNAIHTIIINTVVQFLFFYSTWRGEENYHNQAIKLLLELPPENNKIINHWKSVGIIANNAFETQALIELSNQYCKQKKCLQCGIGASILKMNARQNN